MFWSDTAMSTIHRANMDGTNEQIIVNSKIRLIGMLKSIYFKVTFVCTYLISQIFANSLNLQTKVAVKINFKNY